jgi:hypothetical protein
MKMMARFIVSTIFFSVLAGQAFAQSTAPRWTYTPPFGVPCPCIMNRASRTGPFSTMNDGTRSLSVVVCE